MGSKRGARPFGPRPTLGARRLSRRRLRVGLHQWSSTRRRRHVIRSPPNMTKGAYALGFEDRFITLLCVLFAPLLLVLRDVRERLRRSNSCDTQQDRQCDNEPVHREPRGTQPNTTQRQAKAQLEEAAGYKSRLMGSQSFAVGIDRCAP